MNKISLRFYGKLNAYLPMIWRQRSFEFTINLQSTVVEMLESCVVPLGEVDLILANGEPVDFDYQIKLNDKISIYPIFCSIDISPFNLINRGMLH